MGSGNMRTRYRKMHTPRMCSPYKKLVPTFWSNRTEEYIHLAKIGILEDMHPEYWYNHPSLIMLAAPKKEDTMLKHWGLVEHMIKENNKIHKKVKIVMVVHGNWKKQMKG
jgi:hypothetical protein